ncbi:MAG: hypothetical protein HWQ37_11320 [Nostoc sp. NMS4]|nr:hypothetical protein [Nostoc sp. NMS4]
MPSKWSYQLKLLPQQTAFTSLELNFFEYIRDRISQIGHIPSLGAIIREKSSFNSFGCSWITE